MIELPDKVRKEWESLKTQGQGIIDSFQESTRYLGNGQIPFDFRFADSSSRNTLFGEMFCFLNNYFGTSLGKKIDKDTIHERELRGWEEAYFILGEAERNQGFILNYGSAHRDGGGRENFHYLFVEAEHQLLKQIFLHFQKNPLALKEFSQTVFGWDNTKYLEKNRPDFEYKANNQFDLVQWMKRASFVEISKDYSARKIKKSSIFKGYGTVLKKKMFSKRNYSPLIVDVNQNK